MVGKLQTNCYLLRSQREAIIIDPGDEAQRILQLLRVIKAELKSIVATHAHFDHVLAVDGVRKATGAPFLIHKDDLPMLQSMQDRVRQFMDLRVPPSPTVDGFLREGGELRLGSETLHVLHTPGHSPGSISLSGEGYVMTGDALFKQSIGRTDLPGGDLDTLVHSIRDKLFQLEDSTIVYPGHGPETSIGDEKLANPFVGKVSRFVTRQLISSNKLYFNRTGLDRLGRRAAKISSPSQPAFEEGIWPEPSHRPGNH